MKHLTKKEFFFCITVQPVFDCSLSEINKEEFYTMEKKSPLFSSFKCVVFIYGYIIYSGIEGLAVLIQKCMGYFNNEHHHRTPPKKS